MSSSNLNISEIVQSMIDCNAGMVFTYKHSRPELQRIVHPIMIVGNHVVCIESANGLYKRFRLDGIVLPEENTEESINYINENFQSMVNIEGEKLESNLDMINRCIENNEYILFTYTKSRPEYVRKVIPEKVIENNKFTGFDLDTGSYKTFYISYINPIVIKEEETPVECEGCLNNCPGQRDHMGYNGCLSSNEMFL